MGASGVAWLLWRFPFPTGFVIIFSIASICSLLSWFFLSLSREPRDPVTKPVVSSLEYFKALPAVIRSNKNFENFLIAQVISAFGGLAVGFLLVYGIQRWQLSDGQAASYGIALLLAQSLANLVLGFLADRKGHKLVLEISIAVSIASFVVALFAPDPAWFYLVFALRGVVAAGSFVSSMSLPLEFSAPQDRPTYIGLASTVPGIAGAVAPMIAGGLATFTGYPALFLASALISALAFGMMRWGVRDPRHVGPLARPEGL
jgi:MFS family permease